MSVEWLGCHPLDTSWPERGRIDDEHERIVSEARGCRAERQVGRVPCVFYNVAARGSSPALPQEIDDAPSMSRDCVCGRGGSESRTTASRWPGRSAASRLPDGKPDLQGVWAFRTITPLERPRQFGDKQTLTAEEAA